MPVCPSCGRDNPADFEFCGHCRASMASTTGRAEERKLATMLFADLAGSTELGSRLDPERLRSLLDSYFTAMAACIEFWGGTVEKYVGDAIMAVFGVPVAREDDTERAVRAALDMLERLGELNPAFEHQHGVTLQARIGVNTGEVVAPAGGDVDQRIVAGDAVNVAARLEQAARPGTVLVGARTYAATRRTFRYRPPISLEVKGKTGAVLGYEALGPQRGMEGTRASIGLSSAIVGRGRETELLLSSLAQVSATRAVRTVFVYGAAGIGKSRLLREFTERAALLPSPATIYRGRCLATGRGVTYWALGEILRGAFGIALDDPSDVAGDRLQRGVAGVLSHLGSSDEEIRTTSFALGASAGLSLEGSPLDRMEPQDVGEQISRAWPLLVTALAARGPVVLVFEDIHWAGDQLLEMLERLAVRSQGPILLVATGRPEFAESHPKYGDRFDESTTIRLDALSDTESAELVAGLLSKTALPSDLRAQIVAKAEGNPLFLEEIVGRLIDQGTLVLESDRWVAIPSSGSVPLPDTIHAVLAARIDSLPPMEKRTLQEASVVGRTFWEEPIARALGLPTVMELVSALQHKGFLQAQHTSTFAGQVELQFRHALIRDVAYESLSKARRGRAHAEVASWMEAVAEDRSEEVAELVAFHYAAAVTGDASLAWLDQPAERDVIARKAFDALLLAGTIGRRRYAIGRAVELHEQAIILAPDRSARATALEALGDDHDAAIHGDDALAAYRDAISILRGDPDADEDRGRICMKAAGLILSRSGAFSSAPEPSLIDEFVNEGLACASDNEVLAWLRAYWGATAIWWVNAGADVASVDDRVQSLSSSLVDARAASLPELEAFAQEYLCEVHMARGSYHAVAELSRHTDVFDTIASPAGRSLGLVETAIWARDVAGDAERALDLGMRAHALARALSLHDLMHATGFVIPALFQMGRWRELDPVLDEHVAAFTEETEATCELLHAGVVAGAARRALSGDLSRAQELVALAPPFASTDPLWAGYADGWRARFEVAVGDAGAGLQRARTVFASAPTWPRLHAVSVIIEALTALGDEPQLAAFLPEARGMEDGLALLPPLCDRAEGDVAAAGGDHSTAERLWTRSLEGFERLHMPYDAARTKERLATVAPRDVASSLLESALQTYDRLGARPSSERVRSGPAT